MILTRESTSAACDAVTRLLDGGYLRIYGPVALVAELRFGSPAFAPAVDGHAIANPIAAGYARGGIAQTFRAVGADGTTVVIEGTAGTGEADLVLTDTNIQPNAYVSVGLFTYTHPKESPK